MESAKKRDLGVPVPFKLTSLYVIIGGIWIVFSDQLLAALFVDPNLLTRAQTAKGWFYVLATAILLYTLIQRDFSALENSRRALEHNYDATLKSWVHALDLRDHETSNHTQRVCDLTLRVARAMGVGATELEHIRRGALLHDIGKIGVPDHILRKPGKLDDAEWIIMRQHPTMAYQTLAGISFLNAALDIPYCHHEKWDGTGYPRGLRGDQIPLAARIFAVADVWDALLSNRPYRRAWEPDQVIEYIQDQAGAHFDPKVVGLFIPLISNSEAVIHLNS
ncbi:MAG: HD domain-containing protein [Chloroflexi bacterium]|nr:HD domain-containing protein [Chloroflexota bacterium]